MFVTLNQIMNYLKLFTTLLKVMRVFFILGLAYTIFGLFVELFFPSSNIHTVFSHHEPAIYNDSYFSRNVWIILTSLGVAIMFLMLFKTCSKLINTMNRFKNQEYFVVDNAKDFKSSSMYFVLALVIAPLIMNVLYGIDYLLSLGYMESDADKRLPDWFIKMIHFISEKIPGLIMWLVVGLFLYVMGEVIQKAIDVKEENDLTI